MKAVIFNSGLGKRLGELTKSRPKCMLELYNGESILERQIRILGECGIREFVITTGPFAEQIEQMAEVFPNYHFVFVQNPQFADTNCIVSMDCAYDFLNEDILLLHGDLVFNRELVKKVLNSPYPSVCLFHPKKCLSQKDFKGRFSQNRLLKISTRIFGEDCYAFQPLYKLTEEVVNGFREKTRNLVKCGMTNVYAEDALNEILLDFPIFGLSYAEDFIDEIDNEEDYKRVSQAVSLFDYREQETFETTDLHKTLKDILNRKNSKRIFVVSTQTCRNRIADILTMLGYDFTVFTGFTANPCYEDMQKGMELFQEENYDTLLAIGGGSAMDTAKCIKWFSHSLPYGRLPFIAIPTTSGSGSEATRFAVLYVQKEKQSITHDGLIPQTVILDYELLRTVPDYQKKSTLLDALCQAIESYWAKGATEESKAYAGRAVSLIQKYDKGYLKNETEGLRGLMYASNFSGKAINISRTTAPHAMSYQLTMHYHIGHGHAVALTLPYVWELIAQKGNEEIRNNLLELAAILGYDTTVEAISWFRDLFHSLNLEPVAVKEQDILILTESVNMERMQNTPVPLHKAEIEGIYRRLLN